MKPKGRALLLFPKGDSLPCAYGELNPLRGSPHQLWIGHLVVMPELRGQGIGRRFTRWLAQEAFADRRLARLVMVVFPDNESALCCYRAAGFRVVTRERHRFGAHGGEHVMLRLEITREQAARALAGAAAQ